MSYVPTYNTQTELQPASHLAPVCIVAKMHIMHNVLLNVLLWSLFLFMPACLYSTVNMFALPQTPSSGNESCFTAINAGQPHSQVKHILYTHTHHNNNKNNKSTQVRDGVQGISSPHKL